MRRMSPVLARTLLTWLLRLGGATLLLATLFIAMPTAWMASNHRWLGLGEFPASPIVEYLTRSISGMYALHGGVLLVASVDVRRFAPLVIYLAVANVVFGGVMLAIDLHAGMPAWWTFGEGPPLAATGIVMLLLARVGLRDADGGAS